MLYYYNIGCQIICNHGDQIPALGQSNDPLIIQMAQAINRQMQAGDQQQAASVLVSNITPRDTELNITSFQRVGGSY